MKLLDILHQPWAITPERKREIDAIYATHLRGEKIDLAGIEAAIGRPLNNAPANDYLVQDGVAIIELSGVMSKRMNLFTRISGGFSTQIAAQLVSQAAADPAVEAILLIVDSPGGAVDGTPDFAAAVRKAAEAKPVAAVADGVMASAAYWVGSAAGAVFAASGTSTLGSIGVVATHIDVSGREAQQGIKTTEITAGRFKGIASEHAPLSADGRQSIQDQVDYIYGLFLDAVAQHRGLASSDAAHTQMADGRVFLGQQAVDAGLVDGIASVETVMGMLADGKIAVRPITGAGAAGTARSVATAPSTTPQENHSMDTPKQMTAEDAKPFVEAAVAAKEKEFEARLTKATADGGKAERERIQTVLALGQKMPGHDALIAQMAFDGTTAAGDAALKIADAEAEKRTARATALKADAPKPVPAAAAPATESAATVAAVEPSAQEVATKARTYIAEQAKLGITVSAAQAVAHVSKPTTETK